MLLPVPADAYVPIREETVPGLSHPDCPGQDVTFVVYQKTTESGARSRVTRTLTGAAFCTGSGAWIPAMAWTAEMERAYRTAAADAPRMPPSSRWKRRFVVIVSTAAAIAALAILGLFWVADLLPGQMNPYEASQARIAAVRAAPSAGDFVQANAPDPRVPVRWYVVRAVTPDAVELQAQAETRAAPVQFETPDPTAFTFSGETLRIPRASFLNDHRFGEYDLMMVVFDALPADADS